MNNAVIYWTRTGHSKKLARAIGTALEVEPQNIKDMPKVTKVDHLFIVSGIYSGKSSTKMLKYLSTLDPAQIKHAVLISSSGTNPEGRKDVRRVLEQNKVNVYTEDFHCFGQFQQLKAGHPTPEEIEDSAEFALRVTGKKVLN